MDGLLIWVLVFIVSLVALVKASDFFINSAEKIGTAFNVNPFIIGVTIVALGTSLPELITSLIAVARGETEIVAGNVVGSNIANFGLVMAFVAIISRRLDLRFNVLIVEIPFLLASAFIVGIMMMDGTFDRWDGAIAIIGLIMFLAYTFREGKQQNQEGAEGETSMPVASMIVFLLSGGVIYLSADWLIRSVLEVASILEIGTDVVAQTAVALGTSLPELLVSVQAARKKNVEIAVGNLIGSNIFNSFAVLGIPSMMAPLVVTDTILNFSLPLMIAISVIFFVMMITNKINRWQGFLLLLFYLYFLIYIIKGAIVS